MSLRSEVIRIFNELIGNSKKITELPAATTPLDGTELFEIVQGGVNKKVAKSDVSTGGGGGGTWGSITGTLADQTDLNTALGLRVLKAGDTMSGNLAMGSNKVTGLAAASGNGEAVRYEQITGLAPLASPTFTGTPAAPTATAATNTTQVATTAFVQQELASAGASGDESELSLIATFQYLTI